MTTTANPPQSPVSAADALRAVPITANLLPPEVIAGRRARRVRRLVLASLAALAVVMVGWFGTAYYQTAAARTDLEAAQDDVANLVRQQREFDELVDTQTDSKAISSQLSVLLADDLQWATLLNSVQKVAPSGVKVNRIAGVLATDTARSGTPNAARLPNTSGQKLIGQLTLSGSGPTKEAVARYVDDLGKVPGVGNPLLGDVSLQDGVLDFTVTLDITSEMLGGRYTAKPATDTAKGD